MTVCGPRGRASDPILAALATVPARRTVSRGPGRRVGPELMDSPMLDIGMHNLALNGLARLNLWSGSASMARRPLAALAETHGHRVVRVLDVASGAGDVPVALWQWARRSGISIEIDGCDRSAVAVEHARERAARAGAALRFFRLDVASEPLPAGYDVVMTSLFLHHLADGAVIEVLGRMAAAARRLVLAFDLERRRAGVALAWAASRIATRSPIVHADAVRSVRAGFTRFELGRLAAGVGLDGFVVRRRWPFRLELTWSRP